MNPTSLKHVYLWREKKLLLTFKTGFYELLNKASHKERLQLGKAFPEDYEAFMIWEEKGDIGFEKWLRDEDVIGPKLPAWRTSRM